ncbi:hypothetical protein BpHYR1_036937 [Brachionus plicatilis]|uniref:Uncharacterized protein n=1 Tax=Brachionus plicatilis TaxID=10195 RepID=A0A3M7PIY9_BRAPC|nr:hypothetical protein BpHYR1_036937 [Brachionus plicatilis]
MERVVKRYLMHNQGDSDDPKQNDFEDMRQDLQQVKYDIVNDLKKTREESLRNAFTINNGIQYIAEELLISNLDKKVEDHQTASKVESSETKSSSSERRASGHKLKDFINSNKLFFKSVSALNSKDRSNFGQKTPKSQHSGFKIDRISGVNSLDSEQDQEAKSGENQPIFGKTQSIEEFYQNRLAYDFQTLYENDL